MSLRCRGAPAAGVAFFIAFLMTNYFQPIFSEECSSGNCPKVTQPTPTQRTCSPVPPRLNVSVGLVTSEQIRIEWDPLTCVNEKFNYYHAVLRPRNTGIQVKQRRVYGISSSSVTFTSLLPCTTYDFSLRALHYEQLRPPIVWSPDAESAITTTAKAPGVPKNVRISQGSRSISDATITWEAPTDSPCEPEGYIVTYELLYKDMCERPLGGTVESTHIVHRTMDNTIQGLISYSQYKVCIQGRNVGGDGGPACVNFSTGHKAPSYPPKRVDCTNQSYDSLTFTWNKPRCGYRNGPISNYEYILNACGSNVPRRGRVSGGENGGDITFIDLIPGTMYLFRVRANNDNLSGIYGPAVEANTKITVIHPPGNVVVTSWNETTAVVEWRAPEISVFNTTSYMIVCWQSGFKENTSIVVSYEEEVCAPTCLMEATITGLRPATSHSIQVAAVYKYGEEKSHVLQFQTPEEVRESSGQAVMIPALVCMCLVIFLLLLVIASLLYSRNALRRTSTALKKSAPMSSSRNINHTERELNGSGLEMEITSRVSETNNHDYNHEMESNLSSAIYEDMPAQDNHELENNMSSAIYEDMPAQYNHEMESNIPSAIYENMPAQATKHGSIPVGQLLGYMARRNADGSNS